MKVVIVEVVIVELGQNRVPMSQTQSNNNGSSKSLGRKQTRPQPTVCGTEQCRLKAQPSRGDVAREQEKASQEVVWSTKRFPNVCAKELLRSAKSKGIGRQGIVLKYVHCFTRRANALSSYALTWVAPNC